MNYLAHLHIAHHTSTCFHGNLLGDFVKGNPNRLPFSQATILGIQLHRKVDIFTDNHPKVLALKPQLGEHRRYAGIILDILFDHVLAKHFDTLAQMKLSQFVERAYQLLADIPPGSPERYQRVVSSMMTTDWLMGYQSIDNIHRALRGIEQRLSRPVDLTFAVEWYLQRAEAFDQSFMSFYPELLEQSLIFRQQLMSPLVKQELG